MTGPKIQNLQALRGVAVLLVLLRHVAVMEAKYGRHCHLLPDFVSAGTAGVDLFFVISGFIMVETSRGRHQTPGAFGDFLYRRATRIYPLYWIFSLAVLCVWVVQPSWVNSSAGSRVDLAASFLLLPQSLLPLLGQGWTLTHEIYFYLGFAFSLLLPARRLPCFLGAWAAGLLVGWWLVWPHLPTTGLAAIRLVFHPLTAEFLLGGASALLVRATSLRAAVVSG
jgi:peptidoglycan/LPS O-acetylase OafA/YrhL